MKKGKRKGGGLNMSHYLRQAMEKLAAAGWDLNTVPTSEIVTEARKLIRGKNADETAKLRIAFNPASSQVSIVKRSFTEGSPTGKPGRPSFESLGYDSEAA